MLETVMFNQIVSGIVVIVVSTWIIRQMESGELQHKVRSAGTDIKKTWRGREV